MLGYFIFPNLGLSLLGSFCVFFPIELDLFWVTWLLGYRVGSVLVMFDTPQLTGPVRSANLQISAAYSALLCPQWLPQLGSLTTQEAMHSPPAFKGKVK